MEKKFFDLHASLENDHHRMIALKTLLIRYLTDKGYYFDIKKYITSFFDSFTFDHILSAWAQHPVHIYEEFNIRLEPAEVKAVTELLFDEGFSLKEETESLISSMYELLYGEGITSEYGEYGIDLLRQQVKTDDKLIEPFCGSGKLLSGMYDALMQAYFKCGNDESIESIHRRILADNIFGYAPSHRTCAVSKIVLALKYKDFVLASNIIYRDFSEEDDLSEKFDWAVCDLTFAKERNLLQSYFLKVGKLISDNGRMLCICGRETLFDAGTESFRSSLLSEYTIRKVVDLADRFHTDKPVIFSLEKGIKAEHLFEVFKSGGEDKKQIYYPSIDSMPSVMVLQDKLSSDQLNFYNQETEDMLDRIEMLCPFSLGDLVHFFQGIISGCDKAFVVHDNSLIYSQCIAECGVPWIKGRDITDKINFYGQYLLYTNDMEDICEYPLTQKRLEMYKGLLIKRRECVKGVRRWFELQWGRDKELFLNEKIVFPAKSRKNRFIYDTKGYFFSADMYGMLLSEDFGETVDMAGLAMLLNSDVYEWYMKSVLKSINGELFAYYPDRLKNLRVPPPEIIASFRDQVDINRYFGFDNEEQKKDRT